MARVFSVRVNTFDSRAVPDMVRQAKRRTAGTMAAKGFI
jgi:hypothetical protein